MRRMSSKTKWMIAMSFVTSAALIVTLVVYVMSARQNGSDVNMGFIIGLAALAVAVFAGFTAARLRRSRYVRMLNDAYYAAYEQIADALSASELGMAERREVREDVVAMLLAGQQAGRAAEDVAGKSASAFVARVKTAFGYRSSFVFNLMAALQYGVLLVAFVQLIIYLEDAGRIRFFEAPISFSLFAMFLALIFIVYPLIRRQMRRQKMMWVYIAPIAVGIAFIGLIVLLDNVFGDVAGVRWFLDTEITVIFSWWMAAVFAAVLIGAQAVKWVLRRRSLRAL